MVDTRFHHTAGPASLAALLSAVGAPGANDPRAHQLIVSSADELATAGRDSIALAAHKDYLGWLRVTGAGAVIVSEKLAVEVPPGSIAVVAQRPHILFADLLDRLYPRDTHGVISAFLAPSDTGTFIEDGVQIGTNVVIGINVEIGRGTVIGPNTVIGAGVTIGRDCIIANNCSIDCAHLGNQVVLHPGARIGAEGFGWLDQGRSNRKIPQLGRVILQDRVEIGANTCVDRGALGDTVVGEGSKIDNLVQIGHNARLGRNVLIAGGTTIAGSTIVEDSVLFGVASLTTGHLTVGAGTVVLARAVITKDTAPRSIVGGFPAQDVHSWRREVASLRRLSKGGKHGREA